MAYAGVNPKLFAMFARAARATSSASAGSSSARPDTFPDQLRAFSRQVEKDVTSENKSRKQRRHAHKTKCANCGKAGQGVKLMMCSRCKAVNYCSATCQKAHYAQGHKRDCLDFVDPPFAKHFDPSDRNDVPWPHDPIFGSAHDKGVGVWITTNSDLSQDLDQAFQPPDRRAMPDQTGTPAFRRWAGVEGPNTRPVDVAARKYLGMTMFGIRMVIHNRRTDGQVIGLYLETQSLLVHPMLEEVLLPEQKLKVDRTKIGQNEVLLVEPWVDYNKQARFAILEINGISAPKGSFPPNGTGEYQPAAPPAGAPWDRVLNWRKGYLALGPGDYAVIALQYRLGDGNHVTSYPEVMRRSVGMQLRALVLDTKGTEPGWPARAEQEWNDPKRMIARTMNPLPRAIGTIALWDFSYVNEFYKPYFTEGLAAFAEQRLGARAKHAAAITDQLGQIGFQALLASMETMPPEQRAQFKQQMADMGFPVELIEQLVK